MGFSAGVSRRRALAEGVANQQTRAAKNLQCEESGYCSVGKVDSTEGFKKALAAAAFKKEVVLACAGDINPDIAMNVVFSMWEKDLANVMVLGI